MIQSKERNREELNRQLQDISTYVKILGNHMLQYKKALEKNSTSRNQKKNIFDEKEAKYLIPETCRIPVIYTFPKIHKNKENPPERPIVNGIDSLTARIGQYIDNFIEP